MNQWYALHTKPRQESTVSESLSARGITVFFPTLTTTGRRRSRLGQGCPPLFPCYLFAHVDLTVVAPTAILWTPGLRDMVRFGVQPAPVEPILIETIRERLAAMALPRAPASADARIGPTVSSGRDPLAELEAVFDQTLSGSERVWILLRVIDRMSHEKG